MANVAGIGRCRSGMKQLQRGCHGQLLGRGSGLPGVVLAYFQVQLPGKLIKPGTGISAGGKRVIAIENMHAMHFH